MITIVNTVTLVILFLLLPISSLFSSLLIAPAPCSDTARLPPTARIPPLPLLPVFSFSSQSQCFLMGWFHTCEGRLGQSGYNAGSQTTWFTAGPKPISSEMEFCPLLFLGGGGLKSPKWVEILQQRVATEEGERAARALIISCWSGIFQS